jgi:hypothetical protein
MTIPKLLVELLGTFPLFTASSSRGFAATVRKIAIFAAVVLLTYVLIVLDTRAAGSIAAFSDRCCAVQEMATASFLGAMKQRPRCNT